MSARVAGVLLVCLNLGGTAVVWAQGAQTQLVSRPKPAVQAAQQPSFEALGISLDRVKSALEAEPAGRLKIQEDQPTFRVTIVEKRKVWLPDYVESLKFKWEPIPTGGLYFHEFINMVTPPQARPYGAFDARELVQVVGTSLVASLMTMGLQRAGGYMREPWYTRQEALAREEVRRELEAFLKAHPEAPRPAWWFESVR